MGWTTAKPQQNNARCLTGINAFWHRLRHLEVVGETNSQRG